MTTRARVAVLPLLASFALLFATLDTQVRISFFCSTTVFSLFFPTDSARDIISAFRFASLRHRRELVPFPVLACCVDTL